MTAQFPAAHALAAGLGPASRPDERRARDRRAVLGADAADPLERRDRLSRRHVDRGDRPLHRVRHPDLPALAGRRLVRGGRLEPRPPLPVDQPDRGLLDHLHLHPLPDADGPGGDPVEQRVRLERRQLRADHRRRRCCSPSGIWWLVSARKWFKGPIVQGTEEELERIEAQYDEAAPSAAPSSA